MEAEKIKTPITLEQAKSNLLKPVETPAGELILYGINLVPKIKAFGLIFYIGDNQAVFFNDDCFVIDNFYCKEWNNVGYVCEDQCDQCKKAENLPPLSVMPSDGEILEKFLSEMRGCPFHIKHNERVYELGDIVKTLKKCLSLSKEAPKERMPDVWETIKKRRIGHDKIIKIIRNNSGYEYVTGQGIFANDVRVHKVAKEVVDLFKQRNK